MDIQAIAKAYSLLTLELIPKAVALLLSPSGGQDAGIQIPLSPSPRVLSPAEKLAWDPDWSVMAPPSGNTGS